MPQNTFDDKLMQIYLWIEKYAREQQHAVILTEHWLLGFLNSPELMPVFVHFKVDVENVKEQLIDYLDEHAPKAPKTNCADYKIMVMGDVNDMISQCLDHYHFNKKKLTVLDMLAALSEQKDSFAYSLLYKHQMTHINILHYILRNPADNSDNSDKIRTCLRSLNQKAIDGMINPLIGRQEQIERIMQVLCRRHKNNPILVGDVGVGKTAIAEGLAWLIVNKKVPAPLLNTCIYSVDIDALKAEDSDYHDIENHLETVLKVLQAQPNAVLFIDEIHTITENMDEEYAMDILNLLKHALARGSIRCIGAITFGEYRRIFEANAASSRLFQKIDVSEPSFDEAVQILQGLKIHYEKFHNVIYSDDAILAAVDLSVKFIPTRFLPDKAIDVIDEAGARSQLQNKKTIDQSTIQAVVAQLSDMNKTTLKSDDGQYLQEINNTLKQQIFGQDNAIDRLCDVIMLPKAGLGAINKPIGSFLFAGPTGVGKTQIAKTLANTLSIPLIRFDMSEYMESHSVSRLVGSPPGYVGFENGGLLTKKIQQHPQAVLLIDEIEKAHPDILNIFLQIMDNGILTDAHGRGVSFVRTIIIMTTNAGASFMERPSMGFSPQNHSLDIQGDIKKAFSPEFRNRLDDIIYFNALSNQNIRHIVDKFIKTLQETLKHKNVTLNISDDAKDYLAKKGFDKKMGARPMARLIDNELKKPIAQEILFGKLKNGGKVMIDMMPNNKESSTKLRFQCTQKSIAKKTTTKKSTTKE